MAATPAAILLPPPAPAPVSEAAPPSTPARTVAEAKALVGTLTPDSPLLDIKRLEREIGTGVSMATGGTASRRKVDIVNDMRAALGHDRLEPPMGIPVPPPLPAPVAPAIAPIAPVAVEPAPVAVPPPLPAPVAPAVAPMAPVAVEPAAAEPLGERTWHGCATGAVVADPHGAPVRIYELPAAPGRSLRTLCHTAFDGPETLASPPPGSMYLGSDLGHFHWLTPPPSPPTAQAAYLDRRIIFTPIVAAPPAPPAPPPPPPPDAPRRRRRFCLAPSAGCFGALLAMAVGIILGAALAGNNIAAGVAAIAPHDPGTLSSLLLPAGVIGALLACAVGHVARGEARRYLQQFVASLSLARPSDRLSRDTTAGSR